MLVEVLLLYGLILTQFLDGTIGDAEGLGAIRKKELRKSAIQLGVRSESDVFIVNEPSLFPDSMTAQWPDRDISGLLTVAFSPELASIADHNDKENPNEAPAATIDVLITFDRDGISNHPNHRALYHGAVHFMRKLVKSYPGFACPVTLYTLTSVSIFRKYMGIFDALLSMLLGLSGFIWARLKGTGEKDVSEPARLLFISPIRDYFTALGAMVNCHQSQMVWFRWGWITIARYMTVNDLKREKIQ